MFAYYRWCYGHREQHLFEYLSEAVDLAASDYEQVINQSGGPSFDSIVDKADGAVLVDDPASLASFNVCGDCGYVGFAFHACQGGAYSA